MKCQTEAFGARLLDFTVLAMWDADMERQLKTFSFFKNSGIKTKAGKTRTEDFISLKQMARLPFLTSTSATYHFHAGSPRDPKKYDMSSPLCRWLCCHHEHSSPGVLSTHPGQLRAAFIVGIFFSKLTQSQRQRHTQVSSL